jgi:hypothetical protein
MTDDEHAKYILLDMNCDNCKYMSDYDPVCTYNGYWILPEEGVCECWEKYNGPFDRRSISETLIGR